MKLRFAGIGIAVLILVPTILIAMSLRGLYSGLSDMRTAERSARALTGSRNVRSTLAGIDGNVRSAHNEFGQADTVLGLLNPVLQAASWIPSVGPQAAAAPAAAKTANLMSRGLSTMLDTLLSLVKRDGQGSASQHLTMHTMAITLVRSAPRIRTACADFDRAQRERSDIRSGAQSTRLRSALGTFDRNLPPLRALCHVLSSAPAMLGVGSPRTYLLVYQDQNELRATGGFIGSVGFVTLHDGNLAQQFQGTDIHDNLTIPPPDPVALYNREPGWLFRDSNWSPDFPTTAALEQFFLRLDFHRHVAGVINVTVGATAALLSGTGPLYLPEYHRTVTAKNVAALVDYYTHRTSYSGPLQFQNKDTQRKQFIAIVGRHLIERLRSSSLSEWLHVGQALQTAIRKGDLLIHFNQNAPESVVREIGAAGGIQNPVGDYLYFVDTNLSYNKINPYVHERLNYHVTIQPDGWLRSTIRVQFTDGPIPPAMANYGIGPGAGSLGSPNDYASFVRLYVSPGAEIISQSGWTQPWSSGDAYGKTLLCGYLIVRSGQTRTVTVTYISPPNALSWSRGATYRLTVPHQPGAHLTGVQISLEDGHGRRRSWNFLQPTTQETVQAPIAAVAVRPIPLAKQAPPIVSPRHWIEPHAYLAAPH